tara:strand:+ start:4365 stop:4868 length:504 start_codon:yes stop_codon:yes gene_type:complete
MKIRRGKISDLNNIMKMYNSCVTGMLNNNIDQWDSNYPNKKIIKADLEAKTYYVAEIKKEIVGGINIDQKQDKIYLTVNWKNPTNLFLVVHRLAVKQEFWGYKIGKELMLFTEKIAQKNKMKSVRLDTYSGNPKAVGFYRHLNYIELGAIDLKPNKNEYYCFEKIIG